MAGGKETLKAVPAWQQQELSRDLFGLGCHWPAGGHPQQISPLGKAGVV